VYLLRGGPAGSTLLMGSPYPPLVALWSGLTKNFLGGDRNPQKKRIRLMDSQRKKNGEWAIIEQS
jgi:hypothetical protein